MKTRPLVCLCILALAVPLAQAIIDDAHSMAMDMAAPFVEKGFKVRQDYWKGEVVSAEARRINAQLFKGNEYWFWLGCDADECELTLKVLDQQGRPVESETKTAKNAVGVRMLPPKTGTYVFVFTVKVAGREPASWALAYGYR
ncbi:MAG: hypothetical protein ACR2OZ_08360 [Verrucomicrobiales bacterium]